MKALYDYDASAPGELSIKEDEELYAYDKDDDWLLVQRGKDGGAGFVPANYVEVIDRLDFSGVGPSMYHSSRSRFPHLFITVAIPSVPP